MPTALDPFRFLLIALAGWMNERQLQMIEYLREDNRVLREQLGFPGSPRKETSCGGCFEIVAIPYVQAS